MTCPNLAMSRQFDRTSSNVCGLPGRCAVTGGALKLSRIADGLGHAAPDPVASAGVAQACLTATAALLSAKPAGLHLLLELAAQASTVSGMPSFPRRSLRSPEAREPPS